VVALALVVVLDLRFGRVCPDRLDTLVEPLAEHLHAGAMRPHPYAGCLAPLLRGACASLR
jgi:hypothetical protein